jgi:hypothetical protein
MKYMLIAVIVATLGMSACEVSAPQGAPGPAGAKGAAGADGATGAQGDKGKPAASTVVVVPVPKPDAK